MSHLYSMASRHKDDIFYDITTESRKKMSPKVATYCFMWIHREIQETVTDVILVEINMPIYDQLQEDMRHAGIE